jgi:nucleoside-diphosphate-sugar epimerase
MNNSIINLSQLVTGRTSLLFNYDIEIRDQQIRAEVTGKRILVIGGSGTIGSATVRLLLRYEPACLHVVDQNENGLAELTREIRNQQEIKNLPELRFFPIDFGSPVMQRILMGEATYDLVYNFAAIKHVRSEKDTYSTLQMLDTNIVKARRLIRWISETGSISRFFCVSTDKAASPSSLMGATKLVMECLALEAARSLKFSKSVTSARFANVAFSDGSLLHSFLYRLEKNQPFAIPEDTWRFFISIPEAAQICVLASVCGPSGSIMIPDSDSDLCLVNFESVVDHVLAAYDLRPKFYTDESEAASSLARDMASGYYPVLLTERDTSGEKQTEEFMAPGEEIVDESFAKLKAIKYQLPPNLDLSRFIDQCEALVSDPEIPVSKEVIVQMVSDLLPTIHHHETRKTLDEKI